VRGRNLGRCEGYAREQVARAGWLHLEILQILLEHDQALRQDVVDAVRWVFETSREGTNPFAS
jgi:hypothetical protein